MAEKKKPGKEKNWDKIKNEVSEQEAAEDKEEQTKEGQAEDTCDGETVVLEDAEPETENTDGDVVMSKEEAEAVAAKLTELNDKYLHVVAEYDNFRKRAQKEREGVYADAYADALGELLPIADNLERAMTYSDGDKVIEGVAMTLKQLSASLEKLGIEAFGAAGETFDPTIHNAVMHVEDENLGENVITDVFQKGYRKGDRVIRFAMVKVAN